MDVGVNLCSWTCEMCTMGNDAENLVCFMCQTPRIQLKDLDVKWEWHPNPDQWLAYDYETIVQVEEAYQRWKEYEPPEEEEDDEENQDDAAGTDSSAQEEDVAPSGGFVFGRGPPVAPPAAGAHTAPPPPPVGGLPPIRRKMKRSMELPPHQCRLSKGYFKQHRGYIIDFELNVQISPGGNQRQVRRFASDSDDIFEPFEWEVVDISNRNDDEPLEAPKCVICQIEFEEGDDVVKLRVCSGHGFHRTCIVNWVNLKNKCPLCNTPVS